MDGARKWFVSLTLSPFIRAYVDDSKKELLQGEFIPELKMS